MERYLGILVGIIVAFVIVPWIRNLTRKGAEKDAAELERLVGNCFMDTEGIPDRHALVRFVGGSFERWSPKPEIRHQVNAYIYWNYGGATLHIPEGMTLEVVDFLPSERRMKGESEHRTIQGPTTTSFGTTRENPVLRCTNQITRSVQQAIH